MPPKVTRRRKAADARPSTANKKVDVDVNALVLRAAKARLATVHQREIQLTGMATTMMADVGRAIIMAWNPDTSPQHEDTDSRGYRLRNTATDLRPLRFSIAKSVYEAKSRSMRAHKTTVTRVLEEGLEHFARTGQYAQNQEGSESDNG